MRKFRADGGHTTGYLHGIATVKGHTMRHATITAAPLTPDSFAPFGIVLSPEGRTRLPVNTYGDALDLYCADFATDQPIEWFIVQGKPRPMTALFLERHMQLTQAFLPLGGHGFVMLVARPDAQEDEDDMIALAETRAFHIPGNVGVQLHRGTWHENPFPIMQGQVFLVTSHAALTRGHQTNPSVDLADLPLDLERRFYAERDMVLTVAA
jgi:ureidoglycolate lyase